MKRKALIKKITSAGAKLIRQGGSHEFWESAKGSRFAVPRHKEINELTAKAIIKQAKK